jgi:hypothetical protein
MRNNVRIPGELTSSKGKHLEHDIAVKIRPCALQVHTATYLSCTETFLEIAVRNASRYFHSALKNVQT